MIILLKDIYKLSEKKIYKKGEKVDFGIKDNNALINDGRADLIKVTKVKKQNIKHK